MKTIEIDDAVYAQLAARVSGFGQTPNDVLRHVLGVDEASPKRSIPDLVTDEWLQDLRQRVLREDPTVTQQELLTARDYIAKGSGGSAASPLVQFTRSRDFAAYREAEGKYLALLGWLYAKHKHDFPVIEKYGRGKRAYFATTRKKIEADAPYAQIKHVPGTPYYAMTTLDNRAKRKVLTYVLTTFGYPRDVIEIVVQTIPSSSRAIDLPDF